MVYSTTPTKKKKTTETVSTPKKISFDTSKIQTNENKPTGTAITTPKVDVNQEQVNQAPLQENKNILNSENSLIENSKPISTIPKITFNKDKTVDYEVNGESVHLSEQEYNAMERAKIGLGGGGSYSSERENQILKLVEKAQLQKQQQEVLNQQVNPQQEAGILSGLQTLDSNVNTGQTMGTAAGLAGASAIPGALAGMKLGALGGTAAAPGVGTVVGAVGGALLGAGSAFLTKATIGLKQNVQEAKQSLTDSKTSIGEIISTAKAGGQGLTRQQLIDAYNNRIIEVSQAYANVKDITSNDVQEFLSGGGDEMIELESFFQNEPLMRAEFLTALANVP